MVGSENSSLERVGEKNEKRKRTRVGETRALIHNGSVLHVLISITADSISPMKHTTMKAYSHVPF